MHSKLGALCLFAVFGRALGNFYAADEGERCVIILEGKYNMVMTGQWTWRDGRNYYKQMNIEKLHAEGAELSYNKASSVWKLTDGGTEIGSVKTKKDTVCPTDADVKDTDGKTVGYASVMQPNIGVNCLPQPGIANVDGIDLTPKFKSLQECASYALDNHPTMTGVGRSAYDGGLFSCSVYTQPFKVLTKYPAGDDQPAGMGPAVCKMMANTFVSGIAYGGKDHFLKETKTKEECKQEVKKAYPHATSASWDKIGDKSYGYGCWANVGGTGIGPSARNVISFFSVPRPVNNIFQTYIGERCAMIAEGKHNMLMTQAWTYHDGKNYYVESDVDSLAAGQTVLKWNKTSSVWKMSNKGTEFGTVKNQHYFCPGESFIEDASGNKVGYLAVLQPNIGTSCLPQAGKASVEGKKLPGKFMSLQACASYAMDYFPDTIKGVGRGDFTAEEFECTVYTKEFKIEASGSEQPGTMGPSVCKIESRFVAGHPSSGQLKWVGEKATKEACLEAAKAKRHGVAVWDKLGDKSYGHGCWTLPSTYGIGPSARNVMSIVPVPRLSFVLDTMHKDAFQIENPPTDGHPKKFKLRKCVNTKTGEKIELLTQPDGSNPEKVVNPENPPVVPESGKPFGA